MTLAYKDEDEWEDPFREIGDEPSESTRRLWDRVDEDPTQEDDREEIDFDGELF